MKFGLYLPTINHFAEPSALVELALAAERAGWDGVFLWDHLAWATEAGPARVADTWTTMAAIARRTERIRFGPMVTPVARRRPQKLARETVTIDRLSRGRLVLGVGLGFPPDMEFANFGDDPDNGVRAERLDEGLEVLARLWSGDPVDFEGAHLKAKTEGFLPRPVQEPRVPVWVAGWWPKRRPARRAARWDGMFPLPSEWPDVNFAPDDYREIKGFIAEQGELPDSFDLVHACLDEEPPDAETVAAYEAAGVTWWLIALGIDGTIEQAAGLAATEVRR